MCVMVTKSSVQFLYIWCASARNSKCYINLPKLFFDQIKYKAKYKWNLLEEKSPAITCYHDKEISFSGSVAPLSHSSEGLKASTNSFFYDFVHIQFQIAWRKRENGNKTPKKAIFLFFFFIGKTIKWKSIFNRTVDDKLVSSNC